MQIFSSIKISIITLAILIVLPVAAMKTDFQPAQSPLKKTLIEFTSVSEQEFSKMSNEQKWNLFQDSVEAMRQYALILNERNKKIEMQSRQKELLTIGATMQRPKFKEEEKN